MEEVDIFYRGQSLEPEIRESLQMEPLGHHGMEPTVHIVFLVSLVPLPKSEMTHGTHAIAAAWTRNYQGDIPDCPREIRLVEHGGDFHLGYVRIARGNRVPNIEVNDDVVIHRYLLDQRNQAFRRFRQPRQLSLGGEKVDTLSIFFEFSRYTGLAIQIAGP